MSANHNILEDGKNHFSKIICDAADGVREKKVKNTAWEHLRKCFMEQRGEGVCTRVI